MSQQSIDTQVKTTETLKRPRAEEINDARTKHAYDFVKKSLEKSYEKDLRSLVRNFPTMVQNNGLCAAIAFLHAKAKAHHSALHQTISDWLIEERKLISLKNDDKEESKDLLEAIVNLKSRDQYRMVSAEVMTYMQWVKRFAEGMLSEDEQEEE